MTERQAFFGFLARVTKEGGLIVLITACAFMLLSLFSYDPRDPGWSHLGYSGSVSNAAGVTGAWLADFSFSMLGYVAYLVPAMVIYRALLLLRQPDQGLVSTLPYLFLRFVGAGLCLAAAAALASLHLSNQWLNLPFATGGVLGLNLAQKTLTLFGLVGATLVLLPMLLLGVTLFTNLSWFALAEGVGGLILRSLGRASNWMARRRQALAEREPKSKPSRSEASQPREAAELKRLALPGLKVSEARAEPGLEQLDAVAEFDDEPPFVLDGDAASVSPEPAQSAPPGESVSPGEFAGGKDVHRHLKIVPLSETHQTRLDNEFDADEGDAKAAPKPYRSDKQMPRLALLDPPEAIKSQGYSSEQLEDMSRLLEEKLRDFGVVAEVVEVNPGPVITRFEIQPAPGTKVSKISNLAKDLARSMAVLSVRVVEVIAGKSVVGIEIPNENRETVRLSEVLGSSAYDKANSRLSLGLGNDIAGNPVVVNLAKMPHLLVAGTTGSGKSVGVNAMLLSLLFKATPDEVRLMMVDPKMLELSIYDGIPHLLTPVITDMKEAATGLRWCVAEMERRYRLMAKLGVRNLAGFNDKVKAAEAAGEPILDPLWNPAEEGFEEGTAAPPLQTLPYIVVVIDEFADMMMIVGKKVEELIARIAQKARAAGIHLILATQRPSVDVITGLIKANVPTRIAFQVSSKIDSRTILDQSGAENLLGYGDMLYLPAGSSMPVRVHGAFVADDEVHRVVSEWKKWGPAEFVEEILMENVDADYTSSGSAISGGFEEDQDALYDEAVAFVIQSRRASISAVQRKLKIGYNRAARMIETMEAAGVVSEAAHNGSREVLVPPSVEA
nr:DNA translocase FtsK [Motiliproteus sediminis]